MSSYSELLKDPRWQKRRLEVLEAAEFRCIQCDSEDKTLHVHHTIYRRGKKPWEYEDDVFHVLCEDCHNDRHRAQDELKEALRPEKTWAYNHILGYIMGNEWLELEQGEIKCKCPDFIDGFCVALRVNERRVTRHLMNNDHIITYEQIMERIHYFRL